MKVSVFDDNDDGDDDNDGDEDDDDDRYDIDRFLSIKFSKSWHEIWSSRRGEEHNYFDSWGSLEINNFYNGTKTLMIRLMLLSDNLLIKLVWHVMYGDLVA